MKTGRTLTELAQELDRQQRVKHDFVGRTTAMEMYPTPDRGMALALQGTDERQELGCLDLFHKQVQGKLRIPSDYYGRMRSEAPGLLAANVNHWFRTTPERRMVRTLDGNARAFLSDGYRPLDNYDLANAVLPVLHETPGLSVVSCEITETRLWDRSPCIARLF